jgi:His/Glu/Gln/Arg/opine family amino acid ABC transporter permease subunit
MGYTPDFTVIETHLDTLLEGALATLIVSALSFALGLLLGTAIASLRNARWRALRVPAMLYVELFRATPLLAQLYLIAFGLPSLGITLSPFAAGIVGLTLYTGAYCGEIIRAGLDSVPVGHRTAARSLGLTEWQAFRHVVFPQALRTTVPPLGNQLIETTLSSSLISVIGAQELTEHAGAVASATFRPLEILGAAAVIYLCITLLLSLLFRLLERRLGPRREAGSLLGSMLGSMRGGIAVAFGGRR